MDHASRTRCACLLVRHLTYQKRVAERITSRWPEYLPFESFSDVAPRICFPQVQMNLHEQSAKASTRPSRLKATQSGNMGASALNRKEKLRPSKSQEIIPGGSEHSGSDSPRASSAKTSASQTNPSKSTPPQDELDASSVNPKRKPSRKKATGTTVRTQPVEAPTHEQLQDGSFSKGDFSKSPQTGSVANLGEPWIQKAGDDLETNVTQEKRSKELDGRTSPKSSQISARKTRTARKPKEDVATPKDSSFDIKSTDDSVASGDQLGQPQIKVNHTVSRLVRLEPPRPGRSKKSVKTAIESSSVSVVSPQPSSEDESKEPAEVKKRQSRQRRDVKSSSPGGDLGDAMIASDDLQPITNSTRNQLRATVSTINTGDQRTSVMERANAELGKYTLTILRDRLRRMGLTSLASNRKKDLVSHLVSHLHHLCFDGASQARTPIIVIAIDIGMRNLSHATVLLPALSLDRIHPPTARLMDWALHTRNLDGASSGTYDPISVAVALRPVVDRIFSNAEEIAAAMSSETAPSIQLLIERQSWRFATAMAIPIVRTAAIESMIVAMSLDRMTCGPDIPGNPVSTDRLRGRILGVQPRAVSDHFLQMEGESADSGELKEARIRGVKRSYATKKRDAVKLVESWLDQCKDGSKERRVEVPDELARMFLRESKRDDLSDALMMAVAWGDWRINSWNYAMDLFQIEN
ncbi:hypothetical protein DFJ73DRAFT_824957 [Zopfochytrium polystomum]|nr:hypothetical protein DFJ73DRAFT_824957 [Zopfochytrium polystomum]